jgi:hypothetical protein
MPRMYLDAMEFLEEERDAFRPFEALLELTDEELDRPVADAHGWSARDLIAHVVGWHEITLDVAKDLAVNETSPARERIETEWERRGDDWNEEIRQAWADLPPDEVRTRLRNIPGELRGYLTVIPETRWLKHQTHLSSFTDVTLDHYEEHAQDLAAILRAAGR